MRFDIHESPWDGTQQRLALGIQLTEDYVFEQNRLAGGSGYFRSIIRTETLSGIRTLSSVYTTVVYRRIYSRSAP